MGAKSAARLAHKTKPEIHRMCIVCCFKTFCSLCQVIWLSSRKNVNKYLYLYLYIQ